MKIKIQRYHEGLEPKYLDMEYVLTNNNLTLLEALFDIKQKKDKTLVFNSGCKSGVCGSCAIRVNDKEELACSYKVKDGDYIQSLRHLPIIRDLLVDMNSSSILKESNAFLQSRSKTTSTQNNIDTFLTQSDCILCSSCYSSCPIYFNNSNFIAPFVYSKVLKLILDDKEENSIDKLSSIQDDGIWDCTQCMACTIACPQGLDPKNDILILRNLSVKEGFKAKMPEPSMDFGGFNPSGF